MIIYVATDGSYSDTINAEVKRCGHKVASSTANFDGLIVAPVEFLEDDYGVYTWKITDGQRDIINSFNKPGATYIYDEEHDSYHLMLETYGAVAGPYEDVFWVKTSEDADDLEWLLPQIKKPKSEYDEIAKSMGHYGEANAVDNHFIDSIMSKVSDESSFVKSPEVDSERFETSAKPRSTFVEDNDEVL